jgi:23S rRNA pseudouridine1911/1915/1917 synthase
MTSTPDQSFPIPAELAGKTVAACLRVLLPGQTWTQVRKLIDARRVKINGEIWLDEARRLKEGDAVDVLARSEKSPQQFIDQIPIRYIDEHIVVVEKPPGVSTVRHPAEKDWLEARRMLVITLDDLVMRQIGMHLPRKKHDSRPRLRVVQRLDKETSGLVVFARTVEAERGLGMQFRKHTVTRRYLAVVRGVVTAQTIRSTLVRDRGDGRRGSIGGAGSDFGRASDSGRAGSDFGRAGSVSDRSGDGKEAVTHISVVEALPGYTLLSCKLETGRTHQIRIHLSELGHPVCGERVYNRRATGEPIPDESGAPRLALHAAELGFTHPVTEEALHWEMPPPDDFRAFLERLRAAKSAK